jgi:cytochrome c peroxidase
MHGWITRSGGFTAAVPLLLIGLAGCNQTGPESAPVATEVPTASAPATTAAPKEQGRAQGDATVNLVTPDRSVDPKSLIDVVKEEVEGGEATVGPTPSNYLWLPTNRDLIKDEPLKPAIPAGLNPIAANIPPANPLTKGRYELGRQLFFDPRVSLDGTVSCATCHNPETGWTANIPTAVGILGQTGGRNSPTVFNTVYGRTMFWDGRAPSLEGQAQGPIQNPIEMGKQSYKEIIARLAKISGYQEQFRNVFGTDVTLDGMAKAIASFERVAALTGNSKYDKYIKGDLKALSDSEKRGMVLFGLRLAGDDDFKSDAVLQKAKCTLCHQGANFSDENFHNLGIGWDETTKKFADLGRWAVEPIGSKDEANIGAFKTPTVREVAATGPYMHDGSIDTLEDIVEHYDKGGIANPYLDKDMKKLDLTKQEKADLVAFMKALSGDAKKLDELLPTLPAGPDGKTPDPKAALTPPAKKKIAAAFHPAADH